MVVKLGAADSFNSSGATIVPDPPSKSQRRTGNTSTSPPNLVSNLSHARVLMPQDTLGRELESALAGAGAGELSVQGLVDWEIFNQSLAAQPPNALSQADSIDFSSFLASQPADGDDGNETSDIFSNLQLDTASPYRPVSAHSHHGSISGSEYSYTTTEMSATDTDGDGDSHMELKVEWTETGYSPSAISPQSGHGVSPSLLGGGVSSSGPVRGVPGEDDQKRKDRLEHRRSINRRSAQKHRLRRKEELETLTHTIALRDARIAQLERDLAVERAKSTQIIELLKSQGIDLAARIQTRRSAP